MDGLSNSGDKSGSESNFHGGIELPHLSGAIRNLCGKPDSMNLTSIF